MDIRKIFEQINTESQNITLPEDGSFENKRYEEHGEVLETDLPGINAIKPFLKEINQSC